MAITTVKNDTLLTSLPYQILLYFGGWYYALFVLVEFALIGFKYTQFPYRQGYFASDIALLFIILGIEWCRLYLGRKGNLTEILMPVVFSILLTVPAVLGVVHFLLWQTYVLKLDVIICSIQLVFHGLQTVFALLVSYRFLRSTQLT